MRKHLALALIIVFCWAVSGLAIINFTEQQYETLQKQANGVWPFGATLPLNPAPGTLYYLTNDDGSCTPASGSKITPCWFDGVVWQSTGGSTTTFTNDWLVGNTKTITWATTFINAARFLDGSNTGTAFYTDVTLGPQAVCVVAGVENACNYIRKLASGKKWELQNSSGVAKFTFTESTGALTNVSLNAEDSGNAITLPFEWDLDFCAINPTDSSLSHIWNKSPLTTAPTLTAKTGTNRDVCVLTFPDVDGDYGVGITRRLPVGFSGSFDADIWWDTTGAGNARFQISTKCYASNDADDAAFNTASIITAAAGTSGRPNLQTMTGITTTGCSGGNLMRIQFKRNRAEANDTLNAPLNVEKVAFTGRAVR